MTSKVVYGPKSTDNSIDGKSLGRLIYDSLSTKNSSDIILVEYETGENISREQLFHTSIKIATFLKEHGINKNDIIGIMSPNSWKYLATLISAYFIGATTVGINPKAPSDELRHYLMISKPKMLFISSHLRNEVSALCKELSFIQYLILVDGHFDESGITIANISNKDICCTTFQVEEERTDANILHSSGTTGVPKGVILTQDNLICSYKYTTNPEYIGINETSIILGYLPFFHLFAVFTMLACIIAGKRIVIMETFKPDKFLSAILKHKINMLFLVPPIAVFLAKSPLIHKYDLTSIKKMFCGGAPIGSEMLEMVFQRFKIHIRQIYGLTETIVITCVPENNYKSGTVGKVVNDHELKIIDMKTGDILGPNQQGEVCFKGPAVMKGYKNNYEATRKTIDLEGYLHTGDAGYLDIDGHLYIVDRIKDLIKYKGSQVPTTYLEDILCKHPAVKDACIVGKPDEQAGELTTAFIVREFNNNITEIELKDYVAEKVSPQWYLHGGVIFVDNIPKTPTGKILKRELRKLFH